MVNYFENDLVWTAIDREIRKTYIQVLKIWKYYHKSAFFQFMKEVAGRVFETAALTSIKMKILIYPQLYPIKCLQVNWKVVIRIKRKKNKFHWRGISKKLYFFIVYKFSLLT